MFLLRGIAVSLSIGVIIYACLSLVIALAWRSVCPDALRYSAKFSADLLFALRLAPAAISSAAMLILAVPSFLWLEPRAVVEPIGAVPIVLCACGLGGALWGFWNSVSALRRALRTVARWSQAASVISAESVGARGSVPVMLSSSVLPSLAATGIVKPTVWLSQVAQYLLNERELHTALRHEIVHVRRKDNLRKLILHLIAFPGMTGLQSAWLEATEMAADDAAVSNSSEALDLAAAVIKLSRFAALDPPAELTMALVHSPTASVNARVERLIAWSELQRESPANSRSVIWAVAAVALSFAAAYTHLLIFMHAATEILVR
jgi:Zn-dependent protease with chaperone function